eukprot:gene11712-12933_t
MAGKRIIRCPISQNELFVTLSPAWRKLPMVQRKDGARRFGGEWTAFFNAVVMEKNPHCVFAFKKNYIKRHDSRKRAFPFFRSYAKCTIEPCKCTVFLNKDSEDNDGIRMRFQGNVQHDSSQLKVRGTTGEAREKQKQEMIHAGTKPSHMYRSKLATMDESVYTSGNRSGCGVTPKALQHISEEAGAARNDLSLLVAKVHQYDLKICTEQRALHKSI